MLTERHTVTQRAVGPAGKGDMLSVDCCGLLCSGYIKMQDPLPPWCCCMPALQLKPFAVAVNKHLGKGATFLFNMQGELGTSTLGWSANWQSLMADTRKLALSNGKGQFAPELKMGFKINFERVAGYAGQLPGGIKADMAQRLFAAADYVAISAYAPMPSTPTAAKMQVSTQYWPDG